MVTVLYWCPVAYLRIQNQIMIPCSCTVVGTLTQLSALRWHGTAHVKSVDTSFVTLFALGGGASPRRHTRIPAIARSLDGYTSPWPMGMYGVGPERGSCDCVVVCAQSKSSARTNMRVSHHRNMPVKPYGLRLLHARDVVTESALGEIVCGGQLYTVQAVSAFWRPVAGRRSS